MIDAHTHVWTLDAERYPWQPTLSHVPIPTTPATAEQLLEEMDAAGVDVAILVQPSVYGWDNSYLCDCVRGAPDRFVGVCLVDPSDPDAPAHLRRWCAAGCRGFRINLINETDVSWLLEPRLEPMFAEAVRLGASLSTQMRPRHASAVAELAARHSDLTIVVDYLGPEAFADSTAIDAVHELAVQPGIWFKLLAVGLDSKLAWPFRDLWPLYGAAVEAFGPERVIYGTDFPHVYRATSYVDGVRWLAELPFVDDDARKLIGDGSARRLWRIPAPDASTPLEEMST